MSTLYTMQASKWTVRCWDAASQWVWLYTFSGDGRARTGSVTWKDEGNSMTGTGTWFLEGGKLKTKWHNSQTTEIWSLPIDTQNWIGNCTMHGKPYSLQGIARSVSEKAAASDKTRSTPTCSSPATRSRPLNCRRDASSSTCLSRPRSAGR